MNNIHQLTENGNTNSFTDMDINFNPGSEYDAITCVGTGVYKESW